MGWAARNNPIAQAAAERSPHLADLVAAQESRAFAAHSPEAEELADQQHLRELAALIQDEAQLQKILDDVRPQSIRADVEAQIRPWCAFTIRAIEPAGDLLLVDPDGVIVPVHCVPPEFAKPIEDVSIDEMRQRHLSNKPLIPSVCTCGCYGCAAQRGEGPCDNGTAYLRDLRNR